MNYYPIELNGRHWLIVPVPEGAYFGLYGDEHDIEYHKEGDTHQSLYAVLDNSHGYPEKIADLPEGGRYRLHCTFPEMSEEQAAEMGETIPLEVPRGHAISAEGWKNHMVDGESVALPTDSYKTLRTSLSLSPDGREAVLEKLP